MRTDRISVEWNVNRWSNRYPLHYLATYNREIQGSPEESLKGLWRWKTLNRAPYELDDLLPFLAEAKGYCERIDATVAEAPLTEVADAFIDLRSSLKSPTGPLSSSSRVMVTPQFLLHLTDSQDSYSGRFPILDVMVARAHRIHTAEDASRTLQSGLNGSRDSYIHLIEYFYDNCDTAEQVARLERAMFVQGQAVGLYHQTQGNTDEIRNVTVETARDYLNEIIQYT